MNIILTALLFTWCTYNTWSIHHNYNRIKTSNKIDNLTHKALELHNLRLQRIEKILKLEEENESEEM